MRVQTGSGGWNRATSADELGLPGRIYFRVQEVDGIPRMTELYIDGRGEPIGLAALRRFPVQMLERGAVRLMALARTRISSPGPGPDLSRLAAFFDRSEEEIPASWVRDSLRAQADPDLQIAYPQERFDWLGSESPEPPILEAPPDGRLTDAFLTDVGRAYEAAVQRREPPAITLAALAGVSDRTVHRWVYTARKRGLMPPASSRGRVV